MAFRLQRNKLATIVPVAGERKAAKLINAVQSHFVDVVVRATVTITVASVTAVLNRGSVFAMFDEFGISENGTDRHLYDGKVLRFLSEMSAPSALSATRIPSAGAVGVYNLVEAARIYFAHPFAANPRETAFLEHDVRQNLEVFAKLNASAATRIATAGPATVAVSAVSVTVAHGYVGSENDRPYYIPKVYQQVETISGTNAQLPVYLRTNNALRALVLSQETTTVGEVSDIIRGLALKGDSRDIVGPNSMTLDDLLYDSEFEFGGTVFSTNKAHLGFNFQQFGRLSNLLNPGQDNNLRFELDVATSASAGTSQVRITRVELDPDPTLCKPLDLPI